MNNTATMLASAGLGALILTACTPPHPHHHLDAPLKVISKLDCPNTQGALTRKDVGADGKILRLFEYNWR